MNEIKEMNIKLRVKTEAKKEKVNRKNEDTFEISVREPAENNMANDRVLTIMRKHFPNRAIRLIKGHHSPNKIVSIGD